MCQNPGKMRYITSSWANVTVGSAGIYRSFSYGTFSISIFSPCYRPVRLTQLEAVRAQALPAVTPGACQLTLAYDSNGDQPWVDISHINMHFICLYASALACDILDIGRFELSIYSSDSRYGYINLIVSNCITQLFLVNQFYWQDLFSSLLVATGSRNVEYLEPGRGQGDG